MTRMATGKQNRVHKPPFKVAGVVTFADDGLYLTGVDYPET